jgi:hypothetical protein
MDFNLLVNILNNIVADVITIAVFLQIPVNGFVTLILLF